MLTSIFWRWTLAVAAIASVLALLLLIKAESPTHTAEETPQHTATPLVPQPQVMTPDVMPQGPSPERAAMARDTWTWEPGAQPCTVISDEDWGQYIAAIGAANRQKDLEPLRVALLKAPTGYLCRQDRPRPTINLLSMTTQHWSEEQLAELLQAGLSPSPDLLIGAARAGKARLQYLVELGIPFHDVDVQRAIITILVTHSDLASLYYVQSLGFNLGDSQAGSWWLMRSFLPVGREGRHPVQRLLIDSGARLTQQDFDRLPEETQQQIQIAAAEYGMDLIVRPR